jgi:shikimate kinase
MHALNDPAPAKIARLVETGCVSLIGMAGAGKSTLGRLLAEKLGWAHLDTDRLIEAYYGLPLQGLLDGLGLADFLKAEEALVSMLGVRRTVISTGGSVIYGPAALERLKLLGPVVFLSVSLPTFLSRVGNAGKRGLAMAPGLTREGLYHERQPLYQAAADFTLSTDNNDRTASVERLFAWLKQEPDA